VLNATFRRTWHYACQIGGVGVAPVCLSPIERCAEVLVLTRKANQSIMIGDDIEVSVLSVMGEKVRIGIQAPQEVPVFRTEIYLEIHGDDDQGGEDAPKTDVRAEVSEAIDELGEK
jgi:carbon storage regulator